MAAILIVLAIAFFLDVFGRILPNPLKGRGLGVLMLVSILGGLALLAAIFEAIGI